MLSLLIVSLVAGVCYGQEQGKYSDCATVQTITTTCATQHLAYLKTMDESSYNSMQNIGTLDIPNYLLTMQLDHVCNNTEDLKKYYMCIFQNVTTCLQAVNSTQLMGTPDAETISMGIEDFCKNRREINKTCVMMKMTDVTSCINKVVGEQIGQCKMFEKMKNCTVQMTVCPGGEVVKEYFVSTRPGSCETGGAGQHYLASALLVVSLLLTRFL